jgi:hypothetical protein
MAKQNDGDILHSRAYKIILLCVWLVILTVCLVNRDRFSVDGVLHYSPRNPLLAVLFMLFLFALKSLSVFIFSGILFAASGILFPLPAAIAVNVLGAAVMVSLPYWLGRKLGKDAYAMTITLLLNSEGKKMGKTQSGAVWLRTASWRSTPRRRPFAGCAQAGSCPCPLSPGPSTSSPATS